MKIVWAIATAKRGKDSNKQHAFTETQRWGIGGKYNGNMSLCGRAGVFNGHRYIPINDIQAQEFDKDACCGTCLKIFNGL